MNVPIVPVSVIIPVWRNFELAAEAVASVFAQSFRPVEVIMVDDASGDATEGALLDLQRSYPGGWIKVLAMPKNGGPGEARNLGMDSACGKYLAFLDADDLWHPRKLESQYTWMESNPDAAITCASVGHLQGAKADVFVLRAFRRVPFFKQIFLRNAIATSSVVLRATCARRFAKGKRYAEDFLLWSVIMSDGGKVFRTPTELVWRRKAAFGDTGLSGNVELMYSGALDAIDRLKSYGSIGEFSAFVAKECARGRQLLRLAKIHLRARRSS